MKHNTRFTHPKPSQRVVPFLLLLITVSLLAPPAGAQPRGFLDRACGFDMDRDGVIGEEEDCNVCNGLSNDGDADGSGAT
ncbi:MAG: hypothetical protein HC897_15550 [Thermoanaerobaculia bacterium]|nr:hypothetical protein [Thermoanaerobaculia bacterium]